MHDAQSLADAFVSGARFAQERGGPVEMKVRVLGDLRVPSGRLIVCDPFVTSFDDPPAPRATPRADGQRPP